MERFLRRYKWPGQQPIASGSTNEVIQSHREDRRAHRFLFPAEEEFGGGTANAALAGAHPAAGLELGGAPAGMRAHAIERDILAAAEDCLRLGERAQLVAKCEGAMERRPHRESPRARG